MLIKTSLKKFKEGKDENPSLTKTNALGRVLKVVRA